MNYGQAEFIAEIWRSLSSRGLTNQYNAQQLAEALCRAMDGGYALQAPMPIPAPIAISHDLTKAPDFELIAEMLKRGFAVALMPAQELAEGLAA